MFVDCFGETVGRAKLDRAEIIAVSFAQFSTVQLLYLACMQVTITDSQHMLCKRGIRYLPVITVLETSQFVNYQFAFSSSYHIGFFFAAVFFC